MCLAVPVKIKELKDDNMAVGGLQAVEIEFSVQLLEDPRVGEYVMVHAGVAIERLDEEDALKTIALIKEAAAGGTD
ncbi:HypC/HybG/HupF family hydrogenase formation chaperone [Fibrobacterota bacterium]